MTPPVNRVSDSKVIVLVKGKSTFDGIRHKSVPLAILGGSLLILLLATIIQPVDWVQMWGAVLLFSLMLALASAPGLTSPTGQNGDTTHGHSGLIHIVILAALLAITLVPALWVVVLGTAIGTALRWLLGRRNTESHR